MKKYFLLLSILMSFTEFSINAQNVGINTTGAAPNASAMLDLDATDRGLLIPRVALTATNTAGPITSPATSLLVYNTATAGTAPNNVTPGYYYWNGSSWQRLLDTESNDWRLNGNAGTNPATHFIGTTDAADLVIRTNNINRIIINSIGNVGIGVIPTGTTGQARLSLTRDGTAPCCGGEDATLAIGDNTQSTGRRASISFHNSGEAEGVIRLIQNTINGINSRRIQFYDNQSQGLGIELVGSGRLWYGNSGSRTETRNDAGLQGNAGAQSGFYETSSPTNFPNGASSWWHLIDVRHSNPANNYSMQLSGSFYDQRLWFRKTNNNASQPWREVLTVSTDNTTIENSAWTLSGNFAYSPDDITGTSVLTGDDNRVIYTMPFSIRIQGVDYNTITISTNGWISFGDPGSSVFTNTALPSGNFTAPTIFPYWDDLVANGNNIRYFTTGNAPNRAVVVDYECYTFSGSYNVRFQVTIHENSGLINVHYRDEMHFNANGQSSTIGFQLSGGANAKAYPIIFNGKILDDNRVNASGWSIAPVR